MLPQLLSAVSLAHPVAGARGILYNVTGWLGHGLEWLAEDASEAPIDDGTVVDDEDADWPSMDFRAGRWYETHQFTEAPDQDVYFSECPPTPTGGTALADCTDITEWSTPVELGDPDIDERHPIVVGDSSGNVFAAYMDNDNEEMMFTWRCASELDTSDTGYSVPTRHTPVAIDGTNGPEGWAPLARNGDSMAWTPLAWDSKHDLVHIVYVRNNDDGDGFATDYEVVWKWTPNPCSDECE